LHRIEARHGRERRERWGDRTLDLDLIAWGDVRSDDARLVLPHPRAAERLFVLAPWLELDPDAVLPRAGRVADLVARLREDG
jgi:2-amino-4-hydroxy-6-hydroxymethyldihydropteridine diphosphokinase